MSARRYTGICTRLIMITYCSTTSASELKQILALQQENLPTVLTSEEKNKEGFVTVHHDLDILKRMHNACPHIIAKHRKAIIGYALSMHPKFGNEIDVLKPMFKEIQNSTLKNALFIVMGQICIEKEYRGQGIFRELYKTMAKELASEFNHIVTEVDAENRRSIQAHYAVGFQKLKTYTAAGKVWELIYLPIELYT